MKRFIVSDPAERDIRECALFIGRDNSQAVARFIDASYETFQRLADLPGSGTPYEAISQAFHGMRRSLVSGFEKYLVFYVQASEGVKIVRVIQGSRDIESIFESELPV